MKRFTRLLAALLLVTLCVSTFAVVALAAQKVTTSGSCYIRTGPGLGYATKGTIPKGKTADYKDSKKMDGRGVYWLKVKYKGITGWVSTRYAHLQGSSYDYDDDDDYDDDYGYGDRVRATANVNIRTKPNTNGSKLGTLKKGSSLQYRNLIATDYNGNAWYGVKYNGKNAWVFAKYAYIY